MDEQFDALAAIERHPCPTCDVPAGSACRTGAGKTAVKYHTRRLQLVPRVAEELHVPTPPDRGPGKRWALGLEPDGVDPTEPAPLAAGITAVRIGYARCSTATQELQSQLDALEPVCGEELISPAHDHIRRVGHRDGEPVALRAQAEWARDPAWRSGRPALHARPGLGAGPRDRAVPRGRAERPLRRRRVAPGRLKILTGAGRARGAVRVGDGAGWRAALLALNMPGRRLGRNHPRADQGGCCSSVLVAPIRPHRQDSRRRL
ncbi:zinc finger domain-containing protein [Streptomyces anulatus]|uniref:zinc finger domain-containing protein n=1 Tax=Streptomyces anulatus TaxID=1892 RepID=UPI003D9DC98E